MTEGRSTLAHSAVRWRITAEYDDYETAVAAGRAIMRTGQRSYLFQALDAEGAPLITDDDFTFWDEAE